MEKLQGDLGSYISGNPVILESSNIFVTPPEVKNILSFGEDRFFMAIRILTHPEDMFSQAKQGNSELARYNDFQLLLVVLKEEANSKRLAHDFFELVFPDYQVSVTDTAIDFIKDGYTIGRITPFSFDEFKNILHELFEPNNRNQEEEPEYNPANDLAKAIADKLKQGREKIKEMKQKKEGENFSLFSTYVSALSIGLGIDVNCLLKYTPFQLYDAFNRYALKTEFDLYRSIALQPFADSSSLEEPRVWYGNMY